MMPSQRCEPCAKTGYNLRSLLIVSAVVVGMIVATAVTIRYWQMFPGKHAMRCAFQPVRIVITYAQVTSQLGDVLNFKYPPFFSAVIDAIRPVMDVWSLLFRVLGSSECFGLVGFRSRWLLRVVVLPVMLSLVVLIAYCFDRRHNPDKARLHAKSNMFFAVFFCCE